VTGPQFSDASYATVTRGLSTRREEVCAVARGGARTADQPQVRLVNQCRRLERLAGALVAQTRASHAARFLVDEREQSVEAPASPRCQAWRSSVTPCVDPGFPIRMMKNSPAV
jgi:hypothetical protein